MGHENGGWMNDDQKDAVKDTAMKELKIRAVSLKGAVAYGLENGKRNMIVDLDLLSEILAGHIPVGNNELPPEDVTALLYDVKVERDRLRAAMDTVPNRRSFGDELVCLLNKYSKENGSNTPDFILAEYLTQQLEAWNLAVRAREEWYGRKFSQGSLGLSKEPSALAREIAARVWCDQAMGNIVMDVDAAEAIAKIIDDVRRNQANAQSFADLAASGGIVDAP